MPRVVPSDVVKAADRMFPDMVKATTTFTAIGPETVPRLMALADLVDAVAPELITLEPECCCPQRGLARRRATTKAERVEAARRAGRAAWRDVSPERRRQIARKAGAAR